MRQKSTKGDAALNADHLAPELGELKLSRGEKSEGAA